MSNDEKNQKNQEEDLTWLFFKATHLYFSRMYNQASKFETHPGQFPMIQVLAKYPGLSQREIADRLHIKPPTVNVTLKRMEKAGLIERKADKKDLRVVRIFLSEKGQKVIKHVQKAGEDNNKILTQGFSETELQLFKLFLKKIIINAENFPIGVDHMEEFEK